MAAKWFNYLDTLNSNSFQIGYEGEIWLLFNVTFSQFPHYKHVSIRYVRPAVFWFFSDH